MPCPYDNSRLTRAVLRRFTISLCLFAGCPGALAGAPSAGQAAPFTLHAGLIFIPVVLNGTEECLGLLDTGASVSAVSTVIAKKLKLNSVKETEVVGTTGVVSAKLRQLNSLTIHGKTVRNLRPTSRPIQHGLTPDGRPLDVIVGHDFLANLIIVVDFTNKRLAFVDRAPTCRQWSSFVMDNGIPRIGARLNDCCDTQYRLDTGASIFETEDVYLNITERDLKDLKESCPDLRPDHHLSATGVGGEIKMPVYKLEQIALGAIKIESPWAIVQPSQGYFASPNAVGFVSNNLLRKFDCVVIDYSANRLGFSCEPGL